MKRLVGLIVGLSVLGMFGSCALSDEGNGDVAYDQAKRASGDQQRLYQKTAYLRYKDHFNKVGVNRLSSKFRNRFVEMMLVRANMVINEGTADKDLIGILERDLDAVWNAEIFPEHKKTYADFLTQLADSLWSHGKIMEALNKVDKAIGIADDKAPYNAKKAALAADIIKENLAAAKKGYEAGKAAKDEEMLVRAEYDVQVALLFDPNNEEAKKLLSDLRKANTGYYSAYRRVLDPIPDTTIFRKINKYWILMYIASMSDKGSAEVAMYNYSYNPLRLKPEYFFLVDDAGQRYQASANSKIEKEILDQEHETKFKLYFPKPVAGMAKLIYENGEYYGEKWLK